MSYFEHVVDMLDVLKLTKFTVLFYFAFADKSKMVSWFRTKSLKRYHVYPRLKAVAKTFLEKA